MSLVSKTIQNLYPGLAEDAQKEGAELLQPTTDTVTYSDGLTDEVYGFDVPVPALDTEFDLALIGKKGVWYDHKVSVSNPEPLKDEGKTATISTTVYQMWRTDNDALAFRWVMVNIAISTVVLLAVNMLERRNARRRKERS